MPSLRIRFPEKDEPTTIALSGDQITIGRFANNTIQIVDRVISGQHAELVREPDGHYRLHDRGSTNGTYVNGDQISDFHLREACKMSFGGFEVDFAPEAAPEAAGETLPTRAELAALQQINAELTTQRDALREEIAALRQVRPAAEGEAEMVVAKAEFEKVTAEREALKEADHRRVQEIEKLRADLAVLQRDRANLQRALDSAKAAHAPVPAAAAPPAESVKPSAPETTAAHSPASEETAAPVPSSPSPSATEPSPTATPTVPAPNPALPAAPKFTPKPGALPMPSKVAAGAPAQPRAIPTGSNGPTTIKPLVSGTPTVKAVPNHAPGIKPLARPVAQAPLAAPRTIGPDGTQKIPGEAPAAGAKPISKLPLRPIARPASAPEAESNG